MANKDTKIIKNCPKSSPLSVGNSISYSASKHTYNCAQMIVLFGNSKGNMDAGN